MNEPWYIVKLHNDIQIGFNHGKFDYWQVSYKRKNGDWIPPFDEEYFAWLKKSSEILGADKVYNDCFTIYNLCNNDYSSTNIVVDKKVFDEIYKISLTYKNSINAELVFSILYMAMLSEERKEPSIVGKKIKMLAIYRLLKENVDIETVVNETRNIEFSKINFLCVKKGILTI